MGADTGVEVDEPPVLRRTMPPSEAEVQALIERLAERIGSALEFGPVTRCLPVADTGPREYETSVPAALGLRRAVYDQ